MLTRFLLVIVALLVAVFALAARLGDLPLAWPDEERNAEVAREMKESGAWLVPTFDGLTYLDKPAFYFKAVALSLSWFGESAAAARLVSALFGLGLLGLLFAFCKRLYDETTAALAVMVTATAPLYIAFSRLVIFDMPLSFFVCGAIFAGFLAEEKEGAARRGWYLAGAVATGFATLVKGPVGFVVPTLVLAVFHCLDGRRAALKRLFALRNLLLFFAITLTWFFSVNHLHPDFARYGLIEETFHRFTTSLFHRNKPFYYYGPVMLTGFCVWSILLPESIVAAWRARARWTRADRLFVCWTLVVVLFFSCSQSKLQQYVLTAIVALGVLVARVFARGLERSDGLAARVALRGTMVLAVSSAIAALFFAASQADATWLSRLFRPKGNDLEQWTRVLRPAIAPLAVVTLLAAVARWRRDLRLAFAAFVVFPLLLLSLGFEGLRAYAQLKSSAPLADKLRALPRDTEIVALECFPMGLPFHLKRYVTLVSKDGSELTSNYVMYTLKHTNPWPERVVPVAQLDGWLAAQKHPVYLLAQRWGQPKLDEIAQRRGVTPEMLPLGTQGALLPTPAGH